MSQAGSEAGSDTSHDLTAAWATAILTRLAAYGVRDLCIAPGSRSAPLALAAGRMQDAESAEPGPHFTLHTHFDERGLAFYALGLCRQRQRPVAIVTTSGTALPNLYPALVEARYSYLPLIALTADRPPELLDCGANQAITQPGLFAPHVRAEVSLPPPDLHLSPGWLALRLDAVLRRGCDPQAPGPVHINVQLREPLYGGGESAAVWLAQPTAPAPAPLATPVGSGCGVEGNEGEPVALQPPLLFVAGALKESEAAAVLACAEAAAIPILADIGSQLRLTDHRCVIGGGELLLATAAGREAFSGVRQVFQFGGRLTGKRIAQWLTQHTAEHYLVSPYTDIHDPAWRAQPLYSDIAAFCQTLQPPQQAPLPGLAAARTTQDRCLSQALTATAPPNGELDELSAVATTVAELPEQMALFPGNSLAIRICDLLAPAVSGQPCITQRGASGIDGLIATAAGHAFYHSPGVTAILGDLSVLHDLNSLELAAAVPHPLVLIVLNNDGGGIFDWLPARTHPAVQRQLFRMPHGRDFAHAAAQFALPYRRCSDVATLQAVYREACAHPGASLLEVPCAPQQASERLTELLRRLAEVEGGGC
ncbi:2-succinyl-5-enolpyruvyl-6-hydroxy-3-cyclohexene-1-carboxylic-acid synthase [Halorhodospira abdelmalekii]|nr:2-succinyl-5-enolpyruvyl-6-hydroxy-3-cyclohexene-1-carboxylic-acid synthase [Halorhodospira abdelmalekii]